MTDIGGWQLANAREQRKRERRQEKKKQLKAENQKLQQEQSTKSSQEAERNFVINNAKIAKIDVDTNIGFSNTGTKKPSRKAKNKKAKNKPGESSQSFTKKASLTFENLKPVLTEISQKYPNSYDIQLKILGEHFENGFVGVKSFKPEKMLNELSIETDFEMPLVPCLKEPVAILVGTWLTRIPKNEFVASFFWFALAQVCPMEQDEKIQLSTSGNGLKALIQLILQKQPSTVFGDKNFEKQILPYTIQPKVTEKLSNLKEVPHVKFLLQEMNAPVFAWVFYQLRRSNPTLQLTLWFHYLLPLLCYKSSPQIRKLCISFITVFVKSEGYLAANTKPKDFNILVTGFERLLILKYGLQGKELKAISDVFEPIQQATIFLNSSTPRHYFAMLLRHAAVTGDHEETLRDEVCSILVKCLQTDSQCFARWIEIYPRLIPQSNNLLLYILIHWKSIRKNLNSSLISAQAKEIMAINRKLLTDNITPGSVSEKSIRVCNVTCKALLKEVSRSLFLQIFYFLLIIMILASLAIYFLCIVDGCTQEWCSEIIQCSKQ